MREVLPKVSSGESHRRNSRGTVGDEGVREVGMEFLRARGKAPKKELGRRGDLMGTVYEVRWRGRWRGLC